MLIVALSTGLRFGELLSLTIDNIDLKDGRITIMQQWNSSIDITTSTYIHRKPVLK